MQWWLEQVGARRFEDQVLVPCPLGKDLIFHVLAHMKYHRKMAMFIAFYIYVDIYVWLLNVFGCDGCFIQTRIAC